MRSEARPPAGALIPVVGIGYSAGGLESVRKLLAALPADTGLAIVVISHLKEDQESHLSDILATCTGMTVETIEDGVSVSANSIYVLPPGFDVVLAGDTLKLNKRVDAHAHHLGIDFFFSSLSQSRKSQAFGIVLSGTGTDGTLGLKSIKSEGGVTIVQDPKTAKFEGMPRNAIATGVADLILPPGEIGRELGRLAKHPYTRAALEPHLETAAEPPSELPTQDSEASLLGQILDILLTHTKIDFSGYKINTIRRRIERQMMLRKIETIERYADYLRKDESEIKALYEDIFIHVTDFFRDPESFEALARMVFPELVKGRGKTSPIRVWVPGCATGEETYSLAIALTEFLQQNALSFPIHLFAGDISEPALQKARKGVFAEHQMRSVSKERLDRFFEPVKGGYKVVKSIRDLCIFSRHDVTSNPPIPRVDLISCRNVLIYFSAELQKRIFPVFHYALNPNGFLWLGRAESLHSHSKIFITVEKSHKIFTKAAGPVTHQSKFSTTSYANTALDPASSAPAYPARPADLVKSADQVILGRYSPASVVIDSGLEILQFRGRIVPFLEPSPGSATHHILKMAHRDLAAALRICVQSAKRENIQIRKEDIGFDVDGKERKVSLDVLPLNPAALAKDRQYLVVFEEASAPKIKKTKAKPGLTRKAAAKDERDRAQELAQLHAQVQQELEAAREYQQSLGEEYEAAQEELISANEELRSTNEELQSTNEELQSTNEELGSAKEELQAANEELISTNEELQKRNLDLEGVLKDLAQSEQRFRLMIESVRDYAIFMLDPQGNIATWNDGAKRLKGYAANEIIGEHFSRFYPEEDKDRKPKLELEGATANGRFEDEGWRLRKDGSRFWANVVISAVRDERSNLMGFVKVTRDLTERKANEDGLRSSQAKTEQLARTFDSALSSSPDFYFVLDTNHRFTYVNQTLLKLWGKTLDQALGKTFEQLGYPPELVKLHEGQLKDVLTGKSIRGENHYVNFDGKEGYYEYIFVPVYDDERKVQAISGTSRDITERKNAEKRELERQRRAIELDQLKASEAQFRTLANSLSQLAWVAEADGSITWYNQRWYEYTGTSLEQMAGDGWQAVHDPEILPDVLAGWAIALASGTQFDMEFPLRGADGRFRWFLTRVEPVRDSRGKVISWFGTNTDIDELRRNRLASEILSTASAILAESLDYEKTLQSLANVIVAKAADWCSIAVVEAGSEPRVAAVAHPDPQRLTQVRELFRDYPPDWSAPSGAAQVIRTGRAELMERVSGELLKRSARDARHLELLTGLKLTSAMIVPLVARGKTLGAITFISTSERRKYAATDLSLAEELGRRAGVAVDNALSFRKSQDAIQMRDEFLSIASHELKTPLTSLQIQTQLRERNVAKGNIEAFSLEKLHKMFVGDKRQIDRLTRLIDDMLDVTRIAAKKLALRLEDTDLHLVISEVIDRLAPQSAASGSTLTLEPSDHASGYFDRYRIEQVIVNLLTNAIRYGAGKPVRIKLKHSGELAILTVQDEGIGIAHEDHERIFNQFERATSASVTTGLGLGLYIAQQIVGAHEGLIRVESELGRGTKFVVELPLKQGDRG